MFKSIANAIGKTITYTTAGVTTVAVTAVALPVGAVWWGVKGTLRYAGKGLQAVSEGMDWCDDKLEQKLRGKNVD